MIDSKSDHISSQGALHFLIGATEEKLTESGVRATAKFYRWILVSSGEDVLFKKEAARRR